MRIAILEDNAAQAELIRLWLEAKGHACTVHASGRAFIQDLSRESYDLFILDWEVPDLSGEQVLQWIRGNVEAPVPVMFVTARDSEQDIVSALAQGADDYMAKPLRQYELLARVEALGRRGRHDLETREVIELGRYRIDVGNRVISVDGKPVELTLKEFDLALFLFRNVGRLLSRAHLLEAVWGRNPQINTRTVDTHASRLRMRLGLAPENGWRLASVYQYGYRLERIDASTVPREKQE